MEKLRVLLPIRRSSLALVLRTLGKIITPQYSDAVLLTYGIVPALPLVTTYYTGMASVNDQVAYYLIPFITSFSFIIFYNIYGRFGSFSRLSIFIIYHSKRSSAVKDMCNIKCKNRHPCHHILSTGLSGHPVGHVHYQNRAIVADCCDIFHLL